MGDSGKNREQIAWMAALVTIWAGMGVLTAQWIMARLTEEPWS